MRLVLAWSFKPVQGAQPLLDSDIRQDERWLRAFRFGRMKCGGRKSSPTLSTHYPNPAVGDAQSHPTPSRVSAICARRSAWRASAETCRAGAMREGKPARGDAELPRTGLRTTDHEPKPAERSASPALHCCRKAKAKKSETSDRRRNVRACHNAQGLSKPSKRDSSAGRRRSEPRNFALVCRLRSGPK